MNTPKFLLNLAILCAFGLTSATSLNGGGWWAPMGASQNIFLDPGAPSPSPELGPDPYEKALTGNGFSHLSLNQGQGQEWEWGSQRARTPYAQMDFQFLVVAPMRSMVGLALYSPWPGQEWQTGPDSIRMYQVQPSSYVALLLGWDLLGFQNNHDQQLIASVELPIAYEPGVWQAALAYLPSPNWRLRAEYSQVKPREEIEHWVADWGRFKLKYTEQRVQGHIAGRWAYGPEWAGVVGDCWLTPRHLEGTLTRKGSIWGALGQLVWLGSTWSWRNDFSAEYRQLTDSYRVSTGSPSLLSEGALDLYHYRSRWQRTFAKNWRLGLQGERRLAKGAPGSLMQTGQSTDSLDWTQVVALPTQAYYAHRLETSLYGGDLRKWFSGLYFEAGGDYALSHWSGNSSPMHTWGHSLEYSSASDSEHGVLRLGAGFQSGQALYSYQFSQAFALNNQPTPIQNNGHHRFVISGQF